MCLGGARPQWQCSLRYSTHGVKPCSRSQTSSADRGAHKSRAWGIWGRCPEGKRAETDAERIDMAPLQIESPRHFRFDDMNHSRSGGMDRLRGDGEKARGS